MNKIIINKNEVTLNNVTVRTNIPLSISSDEKVIMYDFFIKTGIEEADFLFAIIKLKSSGKSLTEWHTEKSLILSLERIKNNKAFCLTHRMSINKTFYSIFHSLSLADRLKIHSQNGY